MDETSEYSQVIQDIISSKFIDNAVGAAITQITYVALALAILFYFMSLGWNYLKNSVQSIKGDGSAGFVDIPELCRTLVIMLLIGIYLPVATFMSNGVDYFNSFSAPGEEQKVLLEDYTQAYIEKGVMYNRDMEELALKEVLADPNSSSDDQEFAQVQLNEKRYRNGTRENGVVGSGNEGGERLQPVEKSLSELLNPATWVTGFMNYSSFLLVAMIIAFLPFYSL